MLALIDVLLPVFFVLGAGYFMTWRGLFPAEGIDGLMRYAQSFAVPCLLFIAIARIDLQTAFNPGLLASFYAGATICFLLGVLGGRYLIGRSWEDCIAIGFCCLFSNSVLMGLPLTERAFGAASLAGSYSIVAFHAAYCYTLGIAVMEVVKHRGEPPARMIRAITSTVFHNALIIGILGGFAVNLSGLAIPAFVSGGLDLIAMSALPAALFALGGVLVQYRPEGDSKAIAMICAIALLLHPAITWSLGRALDVPQDLFRAGVLTAAMSPGFNAYLFANMYGHARRVVATSVLVSTGLAFLSVWMWLLILG